MESLFGCEHVLQVTGSWERRQDWTSKLGDIFEQMVVDAMGEKEIFAGMAEGDKWNRPQKTS